MQANLIRTTSKRKQIVHIRNLFFSVVLSCVFYFKRKDVEALLKNDYDPFIPKYIFVLFIISIIISAVLFILSRRKKIIGKLTISNDSINIESRGEVLFFNIKDLNSFSIKTDYIIPKESTVGLISSFNNWLFIDNSGKKYEYQFIIDSFFKGNQLNDLIERWDKLDNFTLIEEK